VLTAAHEAAHAVAGYVLGVADDVDLIQVPTSRHLGGGAGGVVSSKRTLTEIVRNREDAEREIVVTLAGSEAMRELGVDDSGGDSDEVSAARVAVWATTTADEALELLERCRARTKRLVATERFQTLLLELTNYLADPSHPIVSGGFCARLLRGWDPEAPRSGVRGATLEQFAAMHWSPWAEQNLAMMR
jgi:hypothetical protein